jgi:hypothetical protein
MMRELTEEYNNWGLEINFDKTQYMVVGGQGQDIVTDYGTIEKTSHYKYLGVALTSDGKDDKDICNKIVQGKKIIRQLHSLLWNDTILKNTTQRVFKTIAEPPTIYGAEAWVMNSKLSKKINAVEMSFWRRCCGLTLEDHVRNDKIREIMETEVTLTDTTEAKQLKWYGHMKRMEEDRLPKKIHEWIPIERKKRGRPRHTWKKKTKHTMDGRNLQEEDYLDRNRWRLGCDIRPQRL